MPDEEALFVVVGVDEPGGDLVRSAGADVAGPSVENVDPKHGDDDFAVFIGLPFDIGFAEDDEQIARPGVLQLFGHVQVRVHLGFQDRQRPELAQFRGMGIEVEPAGDQCIEAGVEGLAGGGGQIGAGDGAEFRADEDGGALLGAAVQIGPLGGDVFPGPAGDGGERNPVLLGRLLYPGGEQIVDDHLGKIVEG